MTITTRAMVRTSVNFTSPIAASIAVERSDTRSTLMAGGASATSRAMVARTLSTISVVLPPGWR